MDTGMSKLTFASEIEEAAGNEAIIAIVVGQFGGWYGNEDRKFDREGEIVTWAEARDFLDYTYDDGFGGLDCHTITAWTENWVLVLEEYDGSSYVGKIHRNPVPHTPRSS
jgi:hypothetical protein